MNLKGVDQWLRRENLLSFPKWNCARHSHEDTNSAPDHNSGTGLAA